MSYIKETFNNEINNLKNESYTLVNKIDLFCELINYKENDKLLISFLEDNANNIFSNESYIFKIFKSIIKNKNITLTNYMLNNPHFDPNLREGKMLIYAVNSLSVDILNLFLESDKIFNFSRNMKAYRIALDKNWEEGIKLFEEKLNSNELNELDKKNIVTALLQSKNFDSFKKFIENNQVDLNIKLSGGGLLRLAINNNVGFDFIVYLLNNSKADINERNGSLLLSSITRKDKKLQKLLFSYDNIDVNARNGKILREAIHYREKYAIQEMLKRNVSINILVHKLVENLFYSSDSEILKMLLDYDKEKVILNYIKDSLNKEDSYFYCKLLNIKNFNFILTLFENENIKDIILSKITINKDYFFQFYNARFHKVIDILEKDKKYSSYYFNIINENKTDFISSVLSSSNITGRGLFLSKEYFKNLLQLFSKEKPNYLINFINKNFNLYSTPEKDFVIELLSDKYFFDFDLNKINKNIRENKKFENIHNAYLKRIFKDF